MNKYRYIFILFLAVGLNGCGANPFAQPADETGSSIGALRINAVWIRTPIPGTDTDALYMNIQNTGDADDALIGVNSDIAASIELHATTEANGMMTMRPVKAIALPAHTGVAIQPGTYHIMLIGRTRTLKRGDTIPIELQFQLAGSGTVQAEIRDLAPINSR